MAGSSGHSVSTQEALDWAQAVARIRERTPPTGSPMVNVFDLFVGTLLAHPDTDGELRVLLDHFGLTARDIVGDEYARVTPGALDAVLPQVSPGSQSPDGEGLSQVFEMAGSLSSSRLELRHVIGGLLTGPSPLMTQLETALADVGESRSEVAESYSEWLRAHPGIDGVAGVLLRNWLRERNPRTPVNVAGFSTDDVAGPSTIQPDLVGISPESNALAYLVASIDLDPPLAVGLFGDWGSGKSFLMREVRARLGKLLELGTDQPQHQVAIWQNIKHIEFNAWEYVQGDLWSALLEKVFRALGTAVIPDLVADRQQPIRHELDEEEAGVKEAKVNEQEQQKRVADAEQDVTHAKKRLADAEAKVAQEEIDAPAVQEMVVTATKEALARQWDSKRLGRLGNSVGELATALDEASSELSRGRLLLGPYWRSWTHVLLVTTVVLVGPAVAWAVQTLTALPSVASVIAGLAAAIPTVTGWLRTVTAWFAEQRSRIGQAKAAVEAIRRGPVDAARSQLDRATENLTQEKVALARTQADLVTRQQRVAQLQGELKGITPGRVLVEFADARSQDYRGKLGLLGTVREDLRKVEAAILQNNIKAKDPEATHDGEVPNRIVLYIDDLDRCPPAKVVQVLEAVHLLLAFKMFVVFVAVDSRWLSSALIEELHALRTVNCGPLTRRADTPTARDYLEKIFQLPFWVQPLSGEERSRVVSGLLAPTVRADGAREAGTGQGLTLGPSEIDAVEQMLGQSGSGLVLESSVLSITPTELQFLASLGPLLGDTPRRVKRFVNTVQFLLSLRPPLSSQGQRPPRQAVALYAAIHQGLPSIAQELFGGGEAATLEATLSATTVAPVERDVLEGWLDSPGHHIWRQVTLADIADRRDMVRRMGFDRP